jgi:hypothetical protein
VIAMSIRGSGRPLINLTRGNDKVGPSGAVKEGPANPRGKHDIVHDEDYNFFQYYDRSGHRMRYFFILSINLV